jgi:hypothetical protein
VSTHAISCRTGSGLPWHTITIEVHDVNKAIPQLIDISKAIYMCVWLVPHASMLERMHTSLRQPIHRLVLQMVRQARPAIALCHSGQRLHHIIHRPERSLHQQTKNLQRTRYKYMVWRLDVQALRWHNNAPSKQHELRPVQLVAHASLSECAHARSCCSNQMLQWRLDTSGVQMYQLYTTMHAINTTIGIKPCMQSGTW